jgi:hypothetical protein
MNYKAIVCAGVASTVFFLASSGDAQAQTQIGNQRRIGLGLALGYPNVGLGTNFYLKSNVSLQLDATWGWRSGTSGFFARGDVLFWLNRLASGSAGELTWYVGPGAFLGFASGRYCRGYGNTYCSDGVFYLGLEAAIGIAWRFAAVPIDLALEAVPRLGLFDHQGAGLWFDIGAAFHARFYF